MKDKKKAAVVLTREEQVGHEIVHVFHLIKVGDKYLTAEGSKTLAEVGALAVGIVQKL